VNITNNQSEGVNLMSKDSRKTSKVTNNSVSVEPTSTDIKDVVKSDKELKLSKKSVDNVLSNLEGFSSEEQQQIQDVFKKLSEKGRVTNGQGGGTSYDTPEITEFRSNFDNSVESISDGHDVTKTGLKKHYIIDKNGTKRYPMLYLRSKSEMNKTKK
tara:strand:- start:13 stop:483 length:471 start_codon:yes stop_codon:yes gene_type:complete